MDPVAPIGALYTTPIAAIAQIAAVRMLRTIPGTENAVKELVGAVQQNANRLANVAEGVGRNLDITV
jgi:hypothetical protein